MGRSGNTEMEPFKALDKGVGLLSYWKLAMPVLTNLLTFSSYLNKNILETDDTEITLTGEKKNVPACRFLQQQK